MNRTRFSVQYVLLKKRLNARVYLTCQVCYIKVEWLELDKT